LGSGWTGRDRGGKEAEGWERHAEGKGEVASREE
jgi:hypothetical protein